MWYLLLCFLEINFVLQTFIFLREKILKRLPWVKQYLLCTLMFLSLKQVIITFGVLCFQIGAVTALPATPEVNEDTSSPRAALSDTEDSMPEPPPARVKSIEQLNKGNHCAGVLTHHVTVSIDLSKAFGEDTTESHLKKPEDYHLVDTLPVDKKESQKVPAGFKSNFIDTKSKVPQGTSNVKSAFSETNSRKQEKKFTKLKHSVGFDLNNVSVASQEENDSWGGDASPPHTFYRRLSQIRPPVDIAGSIVAARKNRLEKNTAQIKKTNTSSSVGRTINESGLPAKPDSVVKETKIQIDRSSLSPGQCLDLKIPPLLENYHRECTKTVAINRYTYGTEIYTSPQKESSQMEWPRKKSQANIAIGKTPFKKSYTDDLSNLYNQTHNIPKVSLRKNSKSSDKETFVFYRPRIFPRGSLHETKDKTLVAPNSLNIGLKYNTPSASSPLRKPVYQPTPYELFRKNSSRMQHFNSNGRHALDLAVNK